MADPDAPKGSHRRFELTLCALGGTILLYAMSTYPPSDVRFVYLLRWVGVPGPFVLALAIYLRSKYGEMKPGARVAAGGAFVPAVLVWLLMVVVSFPSPKPGTNRTDTMVTGAVMPAPSIDSITLPRREEAEEKPTLSPQTAGNGNADIVVPVDAEQGVPQLPGEFRITDVLPQDTPSGKQPAEAASVEARPVVPAPSCVGDSASLRNRRRSVQARIDEGRSLREQYVAANDDANAKLVRESANRWWIIQTRNSVGLVNLPRYSAFAPNLPENDARAVVPELDRKLGFLLGLMRELEQCA